MSHTKDFVVRQATEADVDRLVELEKQVYGPLGTGYYGEEHIRCWLEVFPEGFFVVEQGGEIIAFSYSQISNSDDLLSGTITDWNLATDNGFTRKTHDPKGDSIWGLTALSTVPGGFFKLVEANYDLAKKLNLKYGFAFARMPGFNAYCSQFEHSGAIDVNIAAICYVAGMVRGLGGELDSKLEHIADSNPQYPAPTHKDKVMVGHLSFPGVKIIGVVQDFMQDPQSRNYAAIILRDVAAT